MAKKSEMGDLRVKDLSIGRSSLARVSGPGGDWRVWFRNRTGRVVLREVAMASKSRGRGGARGASDGIGPGGGVTGAGANEAARPASGSRRDEGTGWPGWARVVATAVLLFHLAAVLAGALGVPPSSELERVIADGFSPYFDLMDLGYSYRFY